MKKRVQAIRTITDISAGNNGYRLSEQGPLCAFDLFHTNLLGHEFLPAIFNP